VKLLLETGRVAADTKDQFSRTALSLASEQGHVPVVDRLLSIEGVDADSMATGIYDSGRTPLSCASGNGHEEILRRLLGTDRVDLDSMATGALWLGRTPLSFAVGNGQRAVAELLLRTGKVNINSKSTEQYDLFRTPISWVGHPRQAYRELKLAEVGVVMGRTPLWWAVEREADVGCPP